MTQTERLEDENKKLIVKCIEAMHREINSRSDIDCLRRIIKHQAVKIDQFKRLFWRIYWK